MATKRKITSLGAVPTPSLDDVLHLVDVSDTTQDPAGTSRKVTLGAIKALFGAIAPTWAAITGSIADNSALTAALGAKAALSHTHTMEAVTGLLAALEGKADAADIADFVTTGQMNAAIAALVESAPGTLNTLNELAAALGDDPNFAATITGLLAAKANAEDVYTKSEVDEAIVEAVAAIPPPEPSEGGGTSMVLSSTEVDLTVAGWHPLYTVPEGKRAIITHAIVRVKEAVDVNGSAWAGVGVQANDIVNPTELTNLMWDGYAFVLQSQPLQRVAQGGEVINFTLDQPAY